MLARVKATGDIFEVSDTTTIYPEHYDKSYNITEVDFLDVEVMNNPCHNPDYWTRLEHQYAGMAMQGMLANANHYLWERKQNYKSLVANAAEVAHTLVEKYKKEE